MTGGGSEYPIRRAFRTTLANMAFDLNVRHGPGPCSARKHALPVAAGGVGPDGVKGPDGVEHPEWWGRKWTDIEADRDHQSEAKQYETVCIWCGITCASIDELEEHEADCE